MPTRTLRTRYPLHSRPLDRLVGQARGFDCSVMLRFGAKQADGKNVLQLLLLAVPQGAEITLETTGADAELALESLSALLLQAEEPGAAAQGAAAQGAAAQGAAAHPRTIPARAGAPGVGRGVLHRLERPRATQRTALPVEQELARLEAALQLAGTTTDELADEDDPFADIFAAQRALLADPGLLHDLHRQVHSGCSVEQAVERVFRELERDFDALGQGFAAERHADVADVELRLLEALSFTEPQPGQEEQRPPTVQVLALHEATPSQMASLSLARVAAVISARGGPTSHAAILARGRGIPLVFAAAERTAALREGEWLEVDGTRGQITPCDGPGASDAPAASPAPAAERAAAPIALRANLGAAGELRLARELGAQGCGLLRTELLYAGRTTAPAVEQQARDYARVARALAPHPVVVRLFDAGSDKPLPFLPVAADEPNPALGQRGIRLLLAHPELLQQQLDALGLAREQCGAALQVMIPMVNDVQELEQVRRRAPQGLALGCMIETPAAALQAAGLARRCDFFSIGSNDLTQYTLALDRQGRAPRLHPAVLQLVARTVNAAHDAGIPCSLCGELAADPLVAPLLVGLGLDALSLAPAALEPVRAALAGREAQGLRRLAQQALSVESAEQIERLLQRDR